MKIIVSLIGDQLFAGTIQVIMNKIEADIMLQNIKDTSFRKIPVINASFAVWAKYKDVPTKIFKRHTRINSS